MHPLLPPSHSERMAAGHVMTLSPERHIRRPGRLFPSPFPVPPIAIPFAAVFLIFITIFAEVNEGGG